jgi:integrase
LSPDAVERFFVAYSKNHGPGSRRSLQAAMRLVLRYTTERGWSPSNLVRAVPSMHAYRLSGVPRGLDDQSFARLLSGLACASVRDRAILHLLATYGARRHQISALRLRDIDWQARSLTFRAHKGGKAVTHALTPLVAESLAAYLRDARPAVHVDEIFLRTFAPHLRLSPACVTAIVYRSMARVGLPPRGPHSLRHAFATRLLAAGQPLKTIADLLGHRSLGSVSMYAKVDYARLLEVADEWPGVLS